MKTTDDFLESRDPHAQQKKFAMGLIHKAEEALSQLGAQVVFTPMGKRVVKIRKELNAIKKELLDYKDES